MRRLEMATELLDGPLDGQQLRGNLGDLARANRWFGGTALSWRALNSLLTSFPPERKLRLLDLGTGAADIPVDLSRRARDAGTQIEIVATDVRPEIVALAAASVLAANVEGIEIRLADPNLRDVPDRSFDVVHASMVLHHLDGERARMLLGEMARVTRSLVIVNDLDRRRLWWVGAWLVAHLFTGNRYTRHDAPLSVRRAYRADEVREMARSVGLREVARHVAWPGYRYALTFAPTEPNRG